MNILLMGLGSIAKKHINALEMLHVTTDIYALRSSQDANPYPGVTDIYDIADAPTDISFIMVCNPTNLHLETIKAVAPLEKPLFIEKPLVRHLQELDELSTMQYPLSTTYVACHLRHHPCIQYAKEVIKGRNVQDVQIKCGSYMPDWVPGIDWKKSFRADKEASGGVHLELIHELDYCTWLFGMPDSCTSDLRNSGELGIDIIDNANYTLSYEDFTASINVNYIDREPTRYIDITFEEGSMYVDILNFQVLEQGEEVFTSDMTVADVYAAQMQYFLNCLASAKEPMNSVKEAGKVLKLALC